ncbi:Uncharacterised protein [Klebsiella pneumoniae]|nr:Uncharacterised protein [Klebsiella pneumoniae]
MWISLNQAGHPVKFERDIAFFGPGFEKLEDFHDFRSEVKTDPVRYKLVIVRLCQEQHIADHFGHPVILFKTGIEDILKFPLCSILTQCDFSLRHQIGDGRSDLMRDIGREIGLAGKDILNLSNHMIERDNQLLQLNGNACRFQSRIKILGGDVFNGIADITKGQVPLTDSDSNDQNNQQAYHDGNRNQVLFQRIEVMEMEING